jgi:hypothetical protein
MAFAVGTMTRRRAAAPMGQREGAGKGVGGNAKTGKTTNINQLLANQRLPMMFTQAVRRQRRALARAKKNGLPNPDSLVWLPKTVKHRALPDRKAVGIVGTQVLSYQHHFAKPMDRIRASPVHWTNKSS